VPRAARESGLKDRIVAELRRRGVWAVRIAASPFQRAGLPDVLVCLREPRGRGLWIEVKRAGEEPRKLQRAIALELAGAGWAVGVARSVDEAVGLVELYEMETTTRR
jgi:Holliday junction resolvase